MKMNKIFNWTFGSIFRTLGRIIAYIIIGIIAVMIFNAGGFKKPKISNILNDVLFMKVDALTMDGVSQGEISIGSSQKIMFLDNDYTSDTWDFSNFNSGSNDYLVIPINGWSGFINHVEVNQDNYEVELVNNYVMFYILSDINQGNQACEIQNNMIVCPLIHNIEYSRLYVEFWYGGNPGGSSQSNFDIRFKLHNYPTLYKTQTNAIIENQNQNNQAIINNQNQNNQAIINNQNQQTQAINNTLTDSNTTRSEGEASSFFSNFNTSDNGGLTSIITAPLSAIQSLTNASCSPLVLPLPFINENLTLPCMRTIYETHFGAFMVLYDTITIGIISYWILVRIFNMVKDFKNPDHDEIEVVDL